MDFKTEIVLKETCAGRILILGVNDGTRDLVDTLRQLDRINEIRIVDPSWNSVKPFQGLDKITLATEEIEDAIKPPVEEFDLIVMSSRADSLNAFVEYVVPIIFAIVNRGWVPRGEHVMVESLSAYREQLAEKMLDVVGLISGDAGYLAHVCEEKTNNEVKLLIRPFFRAMRRVNEIGGTYDLEAWIEAFVSVAFFPGGITRFEDFVGVR